MRCLEGCGGLGWVKYYFEEAEIKNGTIIVCMLTEY